MSEKKTARGGRDGDNRRVPRVEKEIREVVGQYLVRGYRGRLPGVVTVSRVIASSDLKNAKILVTVMPKKVALGAEPDEKLMETLKKSTLTELKAHVHEIQTEVNRLLKMKHCPKLSFYYDEGVGHALKIEGILSKIKTPARDRAQDDGDDAADDGGDDE